MATRKSCKYEDSILGKIMSKKDFEKIYLSMLNLKIGNDRRLSPQETKDYIAMAEPKEMTDKEYYEMKIEEME
jgi:hypothetical protein